MLAPALNAQPISNRFTRTTASVIQVVNYPSNIWIQADAAPSCRMLRRIPEFRENSLDCFVNIFPPRPLLCFLEMPIDLVTNNDI
jgi:hypothetical protein